jgi:signal transduction histidine kinase
MLTGLGVIIFPLLIFLDYLVYREHLQILATIRLITAAVLAIIHILFRRNLFLKNPFNSAWFCLILGSMSITALCIALEGSGCPYYVGVFHVAMAGVLILPSNARQMTPIMLSVIGVYIIGIFVTENFHIQNPSIFIINVFVLFVTGIICTAATYFTDRMRHESFFRYLEISRSVSVLQKELATSNGGIEDLAHEMVIKNNVVQDALELRNNFILIASHELKTPLTSLKLQMDIGRSKIKNKSLDVNYSEKIINTFDTQVKRIIKIVDDMLDVSRVESGKFEIEKDFLNLSKLLEEIISQHYSHDKSINYKSAKAVWGHWDSFKIEQVVHNLLNNAIKYGEGKPITVSVKEVRGEACIMVKDQGSGIDSNYHKKIFEKFERGTASKNYGGIGLGLYLSKQIVEAHHGRIQLISKNGRGSEFTVCLPV